MSARKHFSSVKLEYHSLRFAQMLFKHFPEWKQYLSHYVKEEKGIPVYYLDVSIPPVNLDVTDPLCITAYPEEVIVQWLGGAHSHFDALLYRSTVNYMEAALDFLERIVTDQIIFGYYVRDDKPTGAGFLYDSELNPAPTWFNIKQGSIVIRSWQGTRDTELFAQTA